MQKHIISTEKAPAAIGTYSQAAKAGGTVYVSVHFGLDPASGKLAAGVDAAIERVFANQ
jgi:enamine deaminase RidA (YjgF/YER057c/UK114 family)